MARRGVGSETTQSGARKRKSASARRSLVLAETDEPSTPAASSGDPLTLGPRPYAPRPRKKAASKAQVRRPGRIAAAVAVTLAVGGAVAVGVVQAMHARGHHALPLASAAPSPIAQNATPVSATPVVAAVEARPLTDYQPPDRDQVSSAFAKVGATYRSEGLSGVVRQSMDCFSSLKSAPSYATLDFCVAADAFGEALQRKLSDGQPPAADSYFAGATSRDLSAARAVVGADGDAGARVLDIHRLAGEVSQNDRPSPPVIAVPREEQAAVGPVEAAPRVEVASTPAHAFHPKLVKTHARVEPVVERPRITRVAAPVKSSHAQTRFAEDNTRDAPRKPPRAHAVVVSSTHAPRPPEPIDNAEASPPWAGALRAIRASVTARNDLANRRASEPAEWVDCHRPRTPAEVRLCEGASSGGDGTLGGQVRSGHNR